MPQLCIAAYGCLEGLWLPTPGHCCLSSIAYIGDSHYLDINSNNVVKTSGVENTNSVCNITLLPVFRISCASNDYLWASRSYTMAIISV
jgi:hypothetical protein